MNRSHPYPSFTSYDGTKEWWSSRRLHRLDGPAIERPDGNHEYWINGKQLTEEEFKLYQFVNKL